MDELYLFGRPGDGMRLAGTRLSECESRARVAAQPYNKHQRDIDRHTRSLAIAEGPRDAIRQLK